MPRPSQTVAAASPCLLRLAAVRSRCGPQRVIRRGAISILLSCLALLIPSTASGQTDPDRPKNIRVIVEYIETSHPLVTALMTSKHADSGPKLHARMRKLINEGKAKVLETSIQTARDGRKAVAESITEYIYPTEYDVDRYRWKTPEQVEALAELDASRRYFRPLYYQDFEVRNVGITLQIHPQIEPETGIVMLHYAPEIIEFMQLDTYMEHRDHWGDASMRMPRFKTTRTSTITGLHSGQWAFVGLHTPTLKKGGPDTTRKILLFVRADIMTIGS